MSKLSERLPHLYAELHVAGAFKGDTWRSTLGLFTLMLDRGPQRILDYGCGPQGGLLRAGLEHEVLPHDPYVPEFGGNGIRGAKFDVFHSVDVLEHMPIEALHELLILLRRNTECRTIFLAITTRPANKTFSNGLNVHLTVQPGAWWRGLLQGGLGQGWQSALAREDLEAGEVVLGFVRPHLPKPENP